jgi:hypothetical protein
MRLYLNLHHQNARKIHNIKITNKDLEKVAKSRYSTLIGTNENYIHKEIKSRLNSGNACYHAIQFRIYIPITCLKT